MACPAPTAQPRSAWVQTTCTCGTRMPSHRTRMHMPEPAALRAWAEARGSTTGTPAPALPSIPPRRLLAAVPGGRLEPPAGSGAHDAPVSHQAVGGSCARRVQRWEPERHTAHIQASILRQGKCMYAELTCKTHSDRVQACIETDSTCTRTQGTPKHMETHA